MTHQLHWHPSEDPQPLEQLIADESNGTTSSANQQSNRTPRELHPAQKKLNEMLCDLNCIKPLWADALREALRFGTARIDVVSMDLRELDIQPVHGFYRHLARERPVGPGAIAYRFKQAVQWMRDQLPARL